MGSLQRTDLSKTDKRWKCEKVEVLEEVAKAGYWAYKTYEWVASIPVIP